jgi:hypothetical protein
MESLSILGLKTGKQLESEGVDFGRRKIHPYIFFRAPYYSRDIDYTSVETEINSSYGKGQIGSESRVFIRVDPDNTFVFSSEIRVNFFNEADTKIFDSKKKLSEYLKIIKTNLEIENILLNKFLEPRQKILYNLFSSKAKLFPNTTNPGKLFSDAPINRNSEILVSIPHLTSNYFVLSKS